MNDIEYVNLDKIDLNDYLPLLNSQRIREHLIEHEQFNIESVKAWVDSKLEVNSTEGCKIRAINYKNQLAGWCGIQLENDQYEIAIVIGEKYWGIGKSVYNTIMRWAKELGHKEIIIHLLHTRPEYKYLHKISKSVYETKLLGSKFTTYQLEVK